MTDLFPSWRIELTATAESVHAFEEALEPFCDAVFWSVPGTSHPWRVEGYSQVEPDAERLVAAVENVASVFGGTVPDVKIIPVPPRDWLEENRRQFPPIEIGRFFIYGETFEEPLPKGRTGILLNPGRAFGSGEHATTSGCLAALDDLAKSRSFRKPLDMGCGSGILALAAAKTWQVPVIAVDNDPKAVQVSRENARQNGMLRNLTVKRADGYHGPLTPGTGNFDLIISNILANPLQVMAYDLGRNLRKSWHGGGVAVLSGFLERDANKVMAAHRRQGLRLLGCYDIDGWRTLVLERPAE